MSYIGSTPTTQSFIAGTDYFNGDGSTTAFTLSRNVVSVNDIEVVVNNVVQQPNTAYNVMGTTITFTSAPSAGTGNIYARYLSTTTQSITPSQNTVSYSTLNTDLQGLFGQSFTNRIINGAMMISQRNTTSSVTPASGDYIVDRWRYSASQSSKFTAQQNAGSVTPPAGYINYLGLTSSSAYSVGASDYFGIQQRIEGLNIADLGWGTANAQTVTLTFKVYSSLTGTFGGAIQNYNSSRSYPFTYTISSANTWTSISVTIVGDTSGTWLTTNGIGILLNFGLGVGSTYSGTAGAWAGTAYESATGATSVVGTNGATFYITGVQLEKGSTATSFDYRPYGTELNLCQRYYWKLNTGSSSSIRYGAGFVFGTNESRISIPNPVPMRANPTLSTSGSAGDYRILLTGVAYTCNSVPIGSSLDLQTSDIAFFTASSMTGGQGCMGLSNSTASFLAWSAEL